MSQVSLFNLPPEIIFEIFKYINENCERERKNVPDKTKYEEFISLAACSERLRDMLEKWDEDLYDRLRHVLFLKIRTSYINFGRFHTNLKNMPAKYRETFWRNLSHALRESLCTKVKLMYRPKSFHSDHFEAFHTVIAQLQNKPNLKKLYIDVRGYTLEGLGALRSLEELRLNVRMDIDDLVEICRLNKNLRVLSFMNNETGGKRLAAIVPHCEELEYLGFKMRPDCDASEYRPLAKIPRLKWLEIKGVHEKGTLQPLLKELACTQSKFFNRLYIDDAPLDHNETQAMAQITTLTRVECGFDDPQSIGLLSQLTKLKNLKILSKHDSRTLCEQVLRIIVESKVAMIIELDPSTITYEPSGKLRIELNMEFANAFDYSPLETLPGLSFLGLDRSRDSIIHPFKPILNGFRNAPTLTDLSLREITAWETAAIAKIASLKRLTCGFYDESNAELLAELPELEELTIMSAQSYSYPQPLQRLQGLLAALASKEPQTLQKLCLERRINAVEAKELARLRSLRTLECDFFNHLDIQLLSQLTELEYLNLNSVKELDNILPGVLAVTDSCTKLTRIEIGCALKLSPRANLESGEILVKILEACQDKIDLLIGKGRISFNRKTNKLYLDMDFFGHKRLAIESLARLESVTHMDLEKRSGGSLRELLAALAMRYNSNLQSLNIPHQCLDFGDTMELARIPSLNNFRGRIHEESLRHLLHLSNFQVLKVLRHNSRFIPYEITFDQSTGKLTVSPLNVYLGDDLSNGIELNPLAGLQNLRKVFIAGVFEDGSMRDFLRQLAACQGETLQELRVDRRYEMSNEELREVSRMKSLRTLVCSVSHVQDIEIEQLAHLPHLAVLVVGSHRAGSLKNLLGSLAASKCPTLVHLAVRGAGLTPQEVTEVSAIGSLKGLECAFCSTEGLDVLSQRNCIEHLGITTREGEASLVDLLTAFASSGESNIQKLTIDGLAVGQELATAINLILRIPRLKSLKLPIKDTQGIERLAESLHLEDLTISCFPKRGSLAVLFRALSLKDSTKLNSLFIERTFIDFEEARNLVQVDSITRLKCGFRDYGSFSLLANMTNIENLEITFRPGHQYIYDNIIVECRYLKCIYVGNLSSFSYVYFIKYSLETLKSVRDPSTQGPLEIRTTGSYAKIYAMNSMTAIDIETYVIVTKWRDSDWNDSKDEPESVEERDKESESESDEERDKGTEEESESESDEESKEESYGKIIGIEIFRDVEESDEERDKESESESDEERDKGTEEESESESDEESDKGTEEESDEEIDEESEEESDGKIIGVIRDIKRRRIE